MQKFQSTPPARGATAKLQPSFSIRSISIHAPREGSDITLAPGLRYMAYFNPRPPRGERRVPLVDLVNDFLFQSTPPARGATRQLSRQTNVRIFQSTPPARGATGNSGASLPDGTISIHAPREGSDVRSKWRIMKPSDFNPRPPRGERPAGHASRHDMVHISIHAPREGSDRCSEVTLFG